MTAFEAAEGMFDFEVKSQGLDDEVFWREDIVRFNLLEVCDEVVDGLVGVFGFACEEHGGSGDVLAMVGHGGVGEVEAAEELDACCLEEILGHIPEKLWACVDD